MKNHIGLMVTMLVFAFLTTNCASFRSPVKKASDSFTQKAMQFSAPPGRAAIYVIRPFGFVGAGLPMHLLIDHTEFGKLPAGTFLYGEITPREHILETADFTGCKSRFIRFMAEEGKCYFVYATVGWSLNLDVLSEDEGKRLVSKYELSGDNKFDYGNEVPAIPK
jgi:hypothetical protein